MTHTWSEAQASGKGGRSKQGEGRADDGASEDLGRVSDHEPALPKDPEAEGEDDDAQEAHQDVAATEGSSHPLPIKTGTDQLSCPAQLSRCSP